MKQGTVGIYGSESLPNITGAISPMLSTQANGTAFNLREEDASGALKATTISTQTWVYVTLAGQTSSLTSGKGITLDASSSSSTYQTT